MHIDQLLDRIMRKTSEQQGSRQEDTDRVVRSAEKTRQDAQRSMIEAYRRAGVQFTTPHRRWDD